MLIKIISGGQNGADLGGVEAAVSKGILVGGKMPKGFRTLDGPRPEYAQRYNMEEHSSPAYHPRTYENVKNSDGTIRIAKNINSAGEICTLKAIQQYNKPYFDIHIEDLSTFKISEEMHPKSVAKWIVENNIRILNVAGNSEKTAPGIGVYVKRYISTLIDEIRLRNCSDKSTEI